MTAALLSPGTTQALDLAREALVMLGPARGAVAIGPGEDLLVFLAPTHAPGTYGCTVLMRATDAVVRDVREALRTLEAR